VFELRKNDWKTLRLKFTATSAEGRTSFRFSKIALPHEAMAYALLVNTLLLLTTYLETMVDWSSGKEEVATCARKKIPISH
jgi:hypothetical protein